MFLDLYLNLFFKIICILTAGGFWRLSGMTNSDNRWRWLGVPLIIWASNPSWWGLLSVGLLMGAINIPYGDGSWLRKYFNTYVVRYICGFAYIFSTIFFVVASGNWGLYFVNLVIMPVLIMLLGNQVFGIKNPGEEILIGCSVVLLTVWI